MDKIIPETEDVYKEVDNEIYDFMYKNGRVSEDCYIYPYVKAVRKFFNNQHDVNWLITMKFTMIGYKEDDNINYDVKRAVHYMNTFLEVNKYLLH